MKKDSTKSSTQVAAPSAVSSRKSQVSPRLDECLRRVLAWSDTGDLGHPWGAKLGDRSLTVRLNDFPDEQMYTLLADGGEIGSFDDWPRNWRRLNRIPVAMMSDIVREAAGKTGATKAEAAEVVEAVFDRVHGSKPLEAVARRSKSNANGRRSNPRKSIAH